MDVARDKTVILLDIKGKEAAAFLKTFTARRQGKRFLRLQHLGSQVMLPIRTTHTYLGVKIGYSTFEKATVAHRPSLSWVAFHRLHLFLKSADTAPEEGPALALHCLGHNPLRS